MKNIYKDLFDSLSKDTILHISKQDFETIIQQQSNSCYNCRNPLGDGYDGGFCSQKCRNDFKEFMFPELAQKQVDPKPVVKKELTDEEIESIKQKHDEEMKKMKFNAMDKQKMTEFDDLDNLQSLPVNEKPKVHTINQVPIGIQPEKINYDDFEEPKKKSILDFFKKNPIKIEDPKEEPVPKQGYQRQKKGMITDL